jgi:phage RecT family recombinase
MAGDAIKRLVDDNRDAIAQRLPKYMTAEQFFQLCYWLDKDAKISAAAQRNPAGLLACILRAADCGLVIGSAYEHCWIIPYKDDLQLQVGWRGLVYQLLRAGAIIKATSACVYEGDSFEVRLGDDEQIIHRPSLNDPHRREAKWLFDKRNIQGAYGIAWLPTGLKVHRWCPTGEIEYARSKSKIPDGPAWSHFYPAMASKTAVRRLCKLIEVAGPTPENQEAWARFGQTLELDRSQYREAEEDIPDDLPGVTSGGSNPKSGAATESPGAEHGTPSPPPQGEVRSNRRSAAPSLPSPKPVEPEVEQSDDPITDDQQDKLSELAAQAGMKMSGLKKYVAELYGLPDPAQLRQSQFAKLENELKQRAR